MVEGFAVERRVRAAAEGDPAHLPQRLCEAVRGSLSMGGGTLSLFSDTPHRQMLWATDDAALRVEKLQFGLGEGPCVTAARKEAEVIVGDVHHALTRWPVFGSCAPGATPGRRRDLRLPAAGRDRPHARRHRPALRPTAGPGPRRRRAGCPRGPDRGPRPPGQLPGLAPRERAAAMGAGGHPRHLWGRDARRRRHSRRGAGHHARGGAGPHARPRFRYGWLVAGDRGRGHRRPGGLGTGHELSARTPVIPWPAPARPRCATGGDQVVFDGGGEAEVRVTAVTNGRGPLRRRS